MDSFDFHNIKMEKANAKLRYSRLQKITALFWLMEFGIFLIIISRFTTQLPVAFKLSGEYFRGFSVTAVSHRFVFILGNAIVIVLFLKSGHLSAKDGDTTSNRKLDLYDEYVKNSEKNPTVYKEESTSTKNQRKQSSSSSSTCVSREVANSDAYNSHSDSTKERKEKMQWSQSENLKRVQQQQESSAGRELRRSVTVRCSECVDNEEKTTLVSSYKEDEMSSEEFKRTVEAFIARQQRVLREEEEFSATVSYEP